MSLEIHLGYKKESIKNKAKEGEKKTRDSKERKQEKQRSKNA